MYWRSASTYIEHKRKFQNQKEDCQHKWHEPWHTVLGLTWLHRRLVRRSEWMNLEHVKSQIWTWFPLIKWGLGSKCGHILDMRHGAASQVSVLHLVCTTLLKNGKEPCWKMKTFPCCVKWFSQVWNVEISELISLIVCKKGNICMNSSFLF